MTTTSTTTTAETIPPRLTGARGDLPSTTVLTTGIAEVDEIGERLTALRAEHSDLARRFLERRSKSAMTAAEAADAAAFADAKLASKTDPGAKHVDALRRELADMVRVSRGLAATIRRTDAEYRSAVAGVRDQLEADTLDQLATLRANAAAKVDELVGMLADANRLHDVARWIGNGPSTAGRPVALAARVAGSKIPVADLATKLLDAITAPTALEPAPATTFRPGPSRLMPDGETAVDPADTAKGRRRRGPGAALRNTPTIA
jgi:hypothetical protein